MARVAPPALTVVPVSGLHGQGPGGPRGHVHIGVDGHPPEAPGHLDFRPLLLCAAGALAPGSGLDLHPHRDVEILTIVHRGQLRHVDDQGHDVVLPEGVVIAQSAGAGFAHGQSNPHGEEARVVELVLEPDRAGGAARVRWQRVAPGPELEPVAGRGTALELGCDAVLAAARVEPGRAATWALAEGRRAYVLVWDGGVAVGGAPVEDGGRVLIEGPGRIEVEAAEHATVYLVDMAGPR